MASAHEKRRIRALAASLAAVVVAPVLFCSPCNGRGSFSIPRALATAHSPEVAAPATSAAAIAGVTACLLLCADVRASTKGLQSRAQVALSAKDAAMADFLMGRSQAGKPQGSALSAAEDNVALVFVKPHACTPKVLEFVPAFLAEKGLEVLRSGQVGAEEVEEKAIIDAHYAAIAKVGMARDITSLGLGESEAAKFKSGYSRSMKDAIAAGEVCSAVDAMEVLDVDASELLRRCLEAGYEKLRSGLYCARLEGGKSGQIFVLNGFYARMREKFTAPGVVVNWFVVRFQEADLPWSQFRSSVIGATNPVDAMDGSLRARIRDDWQLLGLKEATNYQDNGVHASAGPLEALHEREVWLGEDPEADLLGKAISKQSSEVSLRELLENPQLQLRTGVEGAAFDLLEDLGSAAMLEALAATKLV